MTFASVKEGIDGDKRRLEYIKEPTILKKFFDVSCPKKVVEFNELFR